MIRILTAAAITLLAAATAWSADAPASSSPSSAADKAAPASPSPSVGKPAPAAVSGTPSAPPAPITPAKPFVYNPKESDIVTGKTDAPVTIVEYGSLSCPHCSHFYADILPILTEKYIDTGKAKLVFRNYLRNEPDLNAAKLVECADGEHREAYVKVLFKTQMKWAYDTNFREALANIAVLGGMDRLAFEACMNKKDVEQTVLNVGKEAEDDYKINSTPTFFINGTQFKGRFDAVAMSTAIENALDREGKK
jgi:protein-disulfide isomerase